MTDKILKSGYRFFLSGFFIFAIMWTSGGCETEIKTKQIEQTIISTLNIDENTGFESGESGLCTE